MLNASQDHGEEILDFCLVQDSSNLFFSWSYIDNNPHRWAKPSKRGPSRDTTVSNVWWKFQLNTSCRTEVLGNFVFCDFANSWPPTDTLLPIGPVTDDLAMRFCGHTSNNSEFQHVKRPLIITKSSYFSERIFEWLDLHFGPFLDVFLPLKPTYFVQISWNFYHVNIISRI